MALEVAIFPKNIEITDRINEYVNKKISKLDRFLAATLAFAYLLNPSYGPVNVALRKLGMQDPPQWLYSAQWAKPALVLLGLWGVGDAMIIFLAGLLWLASLWSKAWKFTAAATTGDTN